LTPAEAGQAKEGKTPAVAGRVNEQIRGRFWYNQGMSEILSSFREKAFLGEAIRNEKLMNQIDQTAKKVNIILNPIDDIAKKKVVGESMKLVEGLAEQGQWKTDNVASLLAAEKDKNRPANQEVAGERLDVLGKGVFVAMRYGGNEELKDVLGTGSAVEIDNVLPEPLKGLGERVRSNIIEDENILKVLDDLDKTRRLTDKMGKPGEKKLEGKISEALDKLLDLEADEEELSMVVAYLGAEMEMMGEGDILEIVKKQIEDQGVDEKVKAEKYFASEFELKEALTIVSKEEWLEGIRTKSYDKATIPSIWMYKAPKWLENIKEGESDDNKKKRESEEMKEWRDLYALTEGISMAVATKRRDSRFGSDIDYIKTNILSMFAFKEKTLKFMLEKESYGFRDALETVMEELFVKNSDGLYVFKSNDENVDDFKNDSSKYKLHLAKRLVDKEGSVFKITDEVKEDDRMDQAVIMTSIACDFLEMGGQFEAADTDRKIGYVSDGLRTVMRPIEKFVRKVGKGELWGGPWGEYSRAVTKNEKEAVDLINKMGVIPNVLCGSILNHGIEIGKDTYKPLGDFLMNKDKVPLTTSEGDFYFSWRKDQVMPACDIWQYVSGKVPLEFKQYNEVDNVISKWRRDLVNAVTTLRDVKNKKGGVPQVTTNVVEAAIGASTGLWPFNPKDGLYLRINPLSDALNAREMYVRVGKEILRGIGMNDQENDELLKTYNLNFWGGNKLGSLMSRYDLKMSYGKGH